MEIPVGIPNNPSYSLTGLIIPGCAYPRNLRITRITKN
jgi:hypothetical protein